MSAVLALVLSAVSCKEEEDTKEYMDGTLTVDHSMPTYVQPGEKYSFTPHGITAPDGTAVQYYFTAPITRVSDTLKNGRTTYEYVVPDTLGTFSLSCVAYPVESSSKYYVSSSTVSFAIVSDNPARHSITGADPQDGDEAVVIDGRTYYSRRSGGLDWLLGNLCTISRDASGKEILGYPFRGSKAMQNIFGAYYTWEEAQKACPPGWHLPSDAEWVGLLKSVGAPSYLEPLHSSPSGAGALMAKASFNGSLMWDYYRDVTITNKALGAIPTGYANIQDDGDYSFAGYLEYAVFWTADEFEGKGVYRYIFDQYDNVFVGSADKNSFAASVRCVRE